MTLAVRVLAAMLSFLPTAAVLASDRPYLAATHAVAEDDDDRVFELETWIESAHRFGEFRFEPEYNFDPRNYAFVAVDWEKDRFGGFRERTSETLGYGRHLLTGPRHLLDAEIGAGARQTEAQDSGERQDEFIGRLGGKYQWTISETSQFAQTLKVESGDENTYTEAVSELKLSILGNLFLSLSLTARNNSDVPPDTRKTDTFTAISLSYGFATK